MVLTEPMATDGYRMLGVTWDDDTTAEVLVSARTHTDGQWTQWFELDPEADVADGPSPNGRLGNFALLGGRLGWGPDSS